MAKYHIVKCFLYSQIVIIWEVVAQEEIIYSLQNKNQKWGVML